jgi:hypothetical protein
MISFFLAFFYLLLIFVNSITISDEETKENEDESCLAYPFVAPVKRKRKPGPASRMKRFRCTRGLSVEF